MDVQSIAVELLKPHPKNPRKHSQLQVDEMVKSINLYGQIRPIIIDDENVILVGHCVRLALLQMEAKEAFIVRKKGLSEDEKARLILADNKIASMGSDDFDMVMDLINGMETFEIPGYDETSLIELLRNTEETIAEYGNITEPKQKESSDGMKTEEYGEPAYEGSNFFHKGDNIDTDTILVNKSVPETLRKRYICPHCGKEFDT